MKPVEITDDLQMCIVADYKSGMRLIDLSNKYGILTPRLIRLLRKDGCFKSSANRWTESEIKQLHENYSCASWEEIEKNLPNRKRSDIFTKASKLGLSRIGVEYSCFSEYEDNIIRQYYVSHGAKYISENILTRRTKGSVETRAQRIGVKTRQRWSDEEESIMKNNYEILSVDDIMKLLPNRTRDSVIGHAQVMGLKSPTNRDFTEKDDEYIKNHYLEMSDDELANVLGRDRYTLKNRRNYLNLHRPVVNSTIVEFFRDHNYCQKQDSMRACGYKCILTGEKFDDIHHLYAFNLIAEEACRELNVDPSFDVNTASEDYRESMLEVFHRIQAKYPLGVCLKKDIHIAFHMKYGYGDNTPEQFEEFMSTYKIPKVTY